MLTDAEKEHIRIEELYRREVQTQIAPLSQGPFWSFLNSSFGLWLLSALFITGVGTTYTKYQQWRSAEDKVRETIERLDLEIGYRFSQVQVRLYAVTQSQVSEQERRSQVLRIIESLPAPPGRDYQHLYPEYSTFGIPSLVAELRRQVREKRTPDELDQVLAHLTGLKVFFEVRNVPLSDPTRIAGAIIEDLVLPRWKSAEWYFLDGSRENPFP